jgi:hypothetical protein
MIIPQIHHLHFNRSTHTRSNQAEARVGGGAEGHRVVGKNVLIHHSNVKPRTAAQPNRNQH